MLTRNSLTWLYVLKTSWRRLEDVLKTFWRRLEKVLARGLEDVLKTSWRRFENVLRTSWRCLKTFLQDVLKTFWRRLGKTSWRRLENVLKTSWSRMTKTIILILIKTFWRRLLETYELGEYIRLDQDVLKTSWRPVHQDECLLGIISNNSSQFYWLKELTIYKETSKKR